MACVFTSGFDYNACKGGAGGIKRILIIEKANVSAFTLTADVITTITRVATKVFREWKLDKEMGYAKSPMVSDQKTDNIIYNHEVGFSIKKFSTTIAAELKLIAQNWSIVIVEDRNGKYRAYGLSSTYAKSNFMNLDSSGDETGTAMTDFNGFNNIVLTSKEDTFAYEVDSTIIAALLTP
jgi:hypothetical protein